MSKLTTAAYDYLAAGLAIIALTGKQPNTTWHPKGLKNALVGRPENVEDIELIERVFDHEHTTGIGIVIQPPMIVVDVDGEEGAEQLALMLGTVELEIETPIAKTARGLHIWYWDSRTWPAGMRTRKLATKLDLKGVGGYVAAPPSIHPSGARYEWLVPLVDRDGYHPPLDLPAPIAAWMTKQDELEAGSGYVRGTEKQLIIDGGSLQLVDAPATLTGLTLWVRTLDEGNRNNGLHWAASVARDEGFTLPEAIEALGEAARHIGLDAVEGRRAILSAYRKGR